MRPPPSSPPSSPSSRHNLNHVAFSCSGSAADDSAIRLIHFYFNRKGQPEKRHVISRRDGYHGSTYLGMSMTGRPGDHSPYFHYISDWVHHVSSPNPYRRPEGMSVEEFCDFLVKELEDKILEIGPEKVAAFIAEPILGAGGVIVPPPGYHKRTAEVLKRYDVKLVSDEVVTAFGRVGHWFASHDMFGIEPDVIVAAKGLTSGYLPLAATIISDELYEGMSAPGEDVWFTNGYTYSGHPVACVAGLKNIEIMEREDILGHVRSVGAEFERRVRALADLPIVGDVRGSHFMMCTEYVQDKGRREVFPEGVNIGKRISDACEEVGLIVRPLEHLNILSPPLILSEEEVDLLVGRLEAGIRKVADDLTREGYRIS
ncbi:MAG: aminotransferase class III-fold pyridoxal phosphate-dependent enzyme [Hyphomicrobiaceae bacterium]